MHSSDYKSVKIRLGRINLRRVSEMFTVAAYHYSMYPSGTYMGKDTNMAHVLISNVSIS
jgi:hypothetical protein